MSSVVWSSARPPGIALAAVVEELHTAVGEPETVLAEDDGPMRLDGKSGIWSSLPLTAEDVPAGFDRGFRHHLVASSDTTPGCE